MDDESDDGSLGDLSMENYTIDLADLARRGSGKIGLVRDEEGDGQQEEDSGVGGANADNGKDDFLAGYDVDLGPLGDKPSSVVVEDQQEECDEVASEADGPEDFTLNMGAWMKGMKQMVKQRDVPSDLDEQQQKREVESAAVDATFGLAVEESIVEPLGTSTPAPKSALQSHEDAKDVKAHAAQRPFPVRGVTEVLQDQAAEEVFQRISALQAEVEEMRGAEERRRSAYERLKEENLAVKKSSQNLKGTSKELAGVKAEAERERMASEERIGTLEAGLRASHGTVQRLRQEMTEDAQMQNTKIEGLNEDLNRLRAKLDTGRAQIADMEQDANTQDDIVKHRDQLIARLTTDAQVTRTELEYAKQEARESRKLAESVQEENDRHTRYQIQQAEELTIAEAALQSKAIELQTAQATIAGLRDTFGEVRPSDEQTAGIIDESSRRVALEALKQEHAGALSALNQKFARQLQLFKRDRDTQAAKHAAELAEAKKIPPPNTAMETELRSAIRVLSSKLEKANAAVRAAKVEAETAQDEIEQARQAAKVMKRDNEIVNQALEGRFREAVEAREREWRRRVGVLFRERDIMGKALMAGWGREEVGLDAIGEKGEQAYRYRFVKR